MHLRCTVTETYKQNLLARHLNEAIWLQIEDLNRIVLMILISKVVMVFFCDKSAVTTTKILLIALRPTGHRVSMCRSNFQEVCCASHS